MNKYLKFFGNRKRWIFIGLSVVIVTATAAGIAKKRHTLFKYMPKEEIKAYFETNILPVLSEYRSNLDNELTAAEKQQIAEVRAALKVLRESKHEFGKALREKKKNGEALSSEEEAEMRATMREMRKLTQSAWDIADAHSTFFDNMFEATTAQRAQWKEEIHGIVETHREKMKGQFEKGEGKKFRGKEDRPDGGRPDEGRPEKGEGRKGGRHQGFGRMGGHHGGPGPSGAMMALAGPHSEVMFLLWDPATPFFSDEEKADFEQNAVTYPNPAFDGSSLRYKIQKNGNVTITLVNAKGEIVATLLEKQLEAGEHTLNNDVSNLQEGVYFYKITTAEGTVTKRFIKK